MRFEFFIGKRYLNVKKENNFVSKISIIGIIVVAIAVIIPILTSSIISGFHKGIINKHQDKDFHIQIQDNYGNGIENYEQYLNDLKIIDEIKYAVPFYDQKAMLKYEELYHGVLVRGLPKEILEDPSFVRNFSVKAGNFDLVHRLYLNIGEFLVDKLHIPIENIKNNTRNWVQLIIPKSNTQSEFQLFDEESDIIEKANKKFKPLDDIDFDKELQNDSKPNVNNSNLNKKKNKKLTETQKPNKKKNVKKKNKKKLPGADDTSIEVDNELYNTLHSISGQINNQDLESTLTYFKRTFNPDEVKSSKPELKEELSDKLEINDVYPSKEQISKTDEPKDEVKSNMQDSISYKQLKVVGVFSSGYMQYDKDIIFTSLDTTQAIFGTQNRANRIGIKLKDPEKAEEMREMLSIIFPYHRIVTWKELNYNLFYAFDWESTLINIILIILIIASFLTIYINLNVVVMDKKIDIAILKSFGTPGWTIRKIFVVEAFMIGAIGTIIGTIIGILLTVSAIDIIIFLKGIIADISTYLYNSPLKDILDIDKPVTAENVLTTSVIDPDRFMYNIDLMQMLLIGVGSIFISLLAGFLPARRADLAKTAEVMHYE